MKSNMPHHEFIQQQVERILSMPTTDYVRYIVVPQAFTQEVVKLLSTSTVTNVVVTTKKHFFTSLIEQINPFKCAYLSDEELVLHCLQMLVDPLSLHPLLISKVNHLDTASKLVKQVEECQLSMTTIENTATHPYLKLKVDLFLQVYNELSTLNTYANVIAQLLSLDIPKIELMISYDESCTELEMKILDLINNKIENELMEQSYDFRDKQPLEVVNATYDRIEIEYTFARIMDLYQQGVSLNDIQIVCSNETLLQKVVQQAYKYNVPLTYNLSHTILPKFDVSNLGLCASVEAFCQLIKDELPSDSYWLPVIDLTASYYNILVADIPRNTFLQLLEMAATKMTIESSQSQGIRVSLVMKETFSLHTFMLGIDENYFIKPFNDNNYFNLQDRSNLKVLSDVMISHQQKWDRYLANLFFNKYETFVMSHSFVDFSGKQLFASYLIKDIRAIKIEAHPIQSNKHDMSHIKQQERKICNIPYPETLKSSVSSLEAFNGCPYQYFLRYGLKIPSYRTITSDSLYIGSLFHNHLAYNLLNTNSLTPPTRDVIAKMIQDYFVENPFDEPQWYKDVLVANLSKHFEHIFKIQFFFLHRGLFQVQDVEKEFAIDMKTIVDDFNHEVLFRGSIDRVDTTNKYIRIIDYKTGNKMIDYDQIGLGLSLQLPMYSLIASKLYNRKVSFMGYARFGETFETISSDQDDITFDKWSRNYRFSGLLLDLDEAIEIQDVRFLELKGNETSQVMPVKGKSQKTQMYSSKSLILEEQWDLLEKHVIEKVDLAVNQIKAGMIDLAPYETKCDFCDYNSVCGFDAQLHITKPIKDKDEIIKKMFRRESDNG